jgi:predicted TIM-barrel fold metal-dependent hydrolase
MQVGHVLEAMPSEHGRPMQLDRIACDFPNLTIVGTHTGWPWVDEMIAVATKWPNVYLNISAWLPKYFGPRLLAVHALQERQPTRRCSARTGCRGTATSMELDRLEIAEDRAAKILRGNAQRIYGI